MTTEELTVALHATIARLADLEQELATARLDAYVAQREVAGVL